MGYTRNISAAGIFIMAVFFLTLAEDQQAKLCFGEKCFFLEVVSRPEQRARGLMFREHLDYNKGMLFIFENERKHGFWMKNTLIPLDIVWLSKDKNVVYVKKNAQPCGQGLCPTIFPDREALYVLELNAGVINDIGLEVGDSISLSRAN